MLMKYWVAFDAVDGIQVVTEVDADGTNGSGVAQTDAHVVAVEVRKVMEADAGEDVASVVEGHDAEAFFDGQRDARFAC